MALHIAVLQKGLHFGMKVGRNLLSGDTVVMHSRPDRDDQWQLAGLTTRLNSEQLSENFGKLR